MCPGRQEVTGTWQHSFYFSYILLALQGNDVLEWVWIGSNETLSSLLTDYFPADSVWLDRNMPPADSTRQPDKERKCLHFFLSVVGLSRAIAISNYIHNDLVHTEVWEQVFCAFSNSSCTHIYLFLFFFLAPATEVQTVPIQEGGKSCVRQWMCY